MGIDIKHLTKVFGIPHFFRITNFSLGKHCIYFSYAELHARILDHNFVTVFGRRFILVKRPTIVVTFIFFVWWQNSRRIVPLLMELLKLVKLTVLNLQFSKFFKKRKHSVIPPTFSSIIHRSNICYVCQNTFFQKEITAKLGYMPSSTEWLLFWRVIVENKIIEFSVNLHSNISAQSSTQILY